MFTMRITIIGMIMITFSSLSSSLRWDHDETTKILRNHHYHDDVHPKNRRRKQRFRQRLLKLVTEEHDTTISHPINQKNNKPQQQQLAIISSNENNNRDRIKEISYRIYNNDDSNDDDDIPNRIVNISGTMAMIHLGPLKTGTTSIQHALHLLKDELKSAEPYHYINANQYYIQYEPHTFVDCFTRANYHNNASLCQTSVLRNIEAQSSHNIIISTEFLHSSLVNVTQLYDYLTSSWNYVRIILYYRRFCDWFLSVHYQGNRMKKVPLRMSMVEHIQQEMARSTTIHDKYVTSVKQRYEQSLSYYHRTNPNIDIKVYNMHQYDDVRESFFCDAIEQSENQEICSLYHKQHETIRNENIHDMIRTVYEEMAYYAHDMNLWYETKEFTINQVIDLMMEYYHNYYPLFQLENDGGLNNDDDNDNTNDQVSTLSNTVTTNILLYYYNLYYNSTNPYRYDHSQQKIISCPNEAQYEWIYQKSIEYEILLFPKYHETIGLQQIQQSLFHDKKYWYCTIDATELFYYHYPIWQEFFHEYVA